jgi:hypothetical protein
LQWDSGIDLVKKTKISNNKSLSEMNKRETKRYQNGFNLPGRAGRQVQTLQNIDFSRFLRNASAARCLGGQRLQHTRNSSNLLEKGKFSLQRSTATIRVEF